jgi:hypothetical protein
VLDDGRAIAGGIAEIIRPDPTVPFVQPNPADFR